ncbi:MAG: DUF5110 domain-containing protein [Defluviitaleaceae bacterium]|nr:DUF5110 domain-containing protein [Defluviitaleaceae bacterium]
MLTAEKRKCRKITTVQKQSDSLLLYSEYGCLQLSPKAENMVRVTFAGQPQATVTAGVGIEMRPDYPHWQHEENAAEVIITTKALKVTVAKETGAIKYYNNTNQLLLAERPHESRILDPFDSYKTIETDNAKTESITTADGVKQLIKSAEKVFDKKLYRTRLNLNWQQDETLFGLGQSPEGMLNLRGTTQYLHQANMKITVPFLISTKGYGLLLSTGSPVMFQDTEYGSYLQTEACQQMDFYFIAGDYAQVIKGYRYLTGKAAMLPKWAFGYMQSQERYETAKELIDTVKEYRRRGIGLDCIILDWISWEEGQWGQKSFDPARFPNPTAMMEEIHALDAKLMISIWPNMNEITPNYAEFREKGLLFPYNDTHDAFNEDARKLYWKQVNEGLFTHGIDAWWCDSSEPITPEWTREEEPEPSALYHTFVHEASNFFPRELGNAYGLYHSKGIYEGQRGTCTSKRVVNLTRSGYTGQQKYGVILWSGDISASWDTMRKQIVAGLQLCACGLPYWTLDIGAFFVKQGKPWYWNGDYNAGEADLGYRELYTRWFQQGAFLPIFRAHGTDVRREIWAYGQPGEPFYDALCAANKLRYKLMPYIYSLAGAAWYDDTTIIRFLAFDFPEDSQAAKIGDQYMFGNAIMVCPVTTPMYYEAGSKPIESAKLTRPVYLPSGCNWYDFHTNEKHVGGQWIEAAADISRIPLFVREGSIIPMEDTLRIYPGQDGNFTLYEDDGDGYGYENGEYMLTKFTWDDRNAKLSREILHEGQINQAQYKYMEEIVSWQK